MNNELSIPTLKMLQFNNIYSASIGNFNYKFFPNVLKNTFKIVVWDGKFCLSKSEPKETAEFELTNQGFKKAVDWLNSFKI